MTDPNPTPNEQDKPRQAHPDDGEPRCRLCDCVDRLDWQGSCTACRKDRSR